MKQDHRTYTRAQVDYIRLAEARQAIRKSIPLYNCALIMAMTDKVQADVISEILENAGSIFESLDSGTLSFEDCAEDIRKNIGIEVRI